MIKHHPDVTMLGKFVEGELPASIAAAIAVHVDMCPKCKAKCEALTEEQAELAFESVGTVATLKTASAKDVSYHEGSDISMVSASEDAMEAMISAITANDEIELAVESREESISVQGTKYKLPRALTNLAMGKWTSIGNLARARLALDEEPIRASLLQIQPGGSVPEHTHKGFELTLLLEGHFKDDMGEYGPGDFIMLDGTKTHSPITEDGCLCYTVANDAQHFTQGLNKLLNPIGSLIY
ncbi:transcriptional regulator [Thalassotalea euphylliae]|uniref:Transcriptional regulator n=1 Tax=Thalassotalea euphylliae TaxID=1655234 RepID=A0A3E0TQQ9_9GAMM|nr:ChrR family anti-sigma-E factor [Thalassotalea euphylliae]REL26879.1 transcriptional regulator [Thalassotalea euphylliae]